ncbi:16085_t:CDS:1, partial [Racocetra fulgida]
NLLNSDDRADNEQEPRGSAHRGACESAHRGIRESARGSTREN